MRDIIILELSRVRSVAFVGVSKTRTARAFAWHLGCCSIRRRLASTAPLNRDHWFIFTSCADEVFLRKSRSMMWFPPDNFAEVLFLIRYAGARNPN